MDKMINKRFDEVFDLSLGRTPSRGVGAYWGGTHTWVSIADMSCGKYISKSKEYITDKALLDTGIPIVKKGTVIMSFKLSIGKVCIADTDLYTNEAIMAFVPKNQYKILPEFLYYYLMCYKWNNSNEVVLGFTLNKKTISQSIVSIPSSIAEQNRIVEILDREFERIDALKVNAEQNLQHAKDLFQAALKQELQPKEGWNISTLQEMLKLTSGDNLTAKSIINGDYPVYGGNGIMGYHNQYNLDGINVIVGRVGALCGNVRLVEGKIWYTDNAFLVHDKKNIFYLPFLTYELQNANLRQYATQAAQPVVSNASMKDVVLAVPPSIKEQEGIVARLEELNERCKALEENYKKTIALCDDMKQALLRKAFNGEL